MRESSHSAGDIQAHLYRAFLEGETPDVALHIRGSWEATYRLHRVVLTQAGFFGSLFTGGFLESSSQSFTGKKDAVQEVDIIFDDPNITRAAFEICVARLYGGGPPLYVDPTLIPTVRGPLTPSFPENAQRFPPPPGHHAASPRFLLSLMATAMYLSIPSVVSQIVFLVLKTIGPTTAVRYLNFAIGRGIGENSYNDPEAAATLEKIALVVQQRRPDFSRASSLHSCRSRSVERDVTERLGNLNVQKEGSSDPEAIELYSTASVHSSSNILNEYNPSYSYGSISDKVGEAAVCWLTRWGEDMLSYEESQKEQTIAKSGIKWEDGPLIWRRGGLDSHWIKAIISSDSFFVKNERERYNLACRVVEMRRRQGIVEEEECVWDALFARGIYYIHMSLDDLMFISQDISPTTGLPFVPISTIQSAHWGQSLIRQHVMSRPFISLPTASPGSPVPRDKELGLSITTAEIAAINETQSQKNRHTEEQIYYPVAIDSSYRIGDDAALEGATMDQLFEAPNRSFDGKRVIPPPGSQANLFGAYNSAYTASECVTADPTRQQRWSPFPPFRFSAEFWGVEAMKEKSRLHSQTAWYAGSLFNVYVQVVKKKGVQLGVYLHRQSFVDPIPLPSVPPESTILTHECASRTRSASLSAAVPASPAAISIPSTRPFTAHNNVPGSSSHSRSSSATPLSSPISLHLSPLPSFPFAHTPSAPYQPYRDPRQSLLAYFSILCASATGSSLTRFSSGPDVFSINQSWGWKSSRTEDYIDQLVESDASTSREVSLRATVLIGIV